MHGSLIMGNGRLDNGGKSRSSCPSTTGFRPDGRGGIAATYLSADHDIRTVDGMTAYWVISIKGSWRTH